MHDLRLEKESLKPSPTVRGLPDMCEELATMCVLNYLGGPGLSQKPLTMSLDPVEQELNSVCSIIPWSGALILTGSGFWAWT